MACLLITVSLSAVVAIGYGTTAGGRVVVIGGGIGGLAVAGRLAKKGANVLVLEKNSREELGGRVGEEVWRGHRWETGASLLLLPEVYEETLVALGAESTELGLVRVRPSYAVWYDEEIGRGPIELGGEDAAASRARLELEAPGAFEKLSRYAHIAAEYLRAGWPLFIEERIVDSLPKLARFIVTCVQAWPLASQDAQLRSIFPESPRLRALCAFNDLYVGLTPYRAPAVFSLLSAIEVADKLEGADPPLNALGVYYARGGLKTYARQLVNACERLGVQIQCDVEVDRVETTGRAASAAVDTSGRAYPADYFVVNADLAAAEPRLFGKKSRDTYDNWTYSTTSYTFLWAFDVVLAPLRHHNVFLTTSPTNGDDPFRAAWDWALPPSRSSSQNGENHDERSLPPFHFYVCAAARTDPSAAPTGGDSIMVLIPTPPLDDHDKEPTDMTDLFRDYVLRRLEDICGDVRPHITYERVIRPSDWRKKYGLRRGAVFGLAHGLNQLAVFRPGRKSPRLDNVAFVGASSRPGNGVPLVLTSAKLCAAQISRDLKLST